MYTPSELLERASASRTQEISEHDDDRNRCVGRGEREVRAELAIHDVADELRCAADDLIHVEIAECQRKRKDRTGDDGRRKLREDHAKERSARLRTQVGGRLQQ